MNLLTYDNDNDIASDKHDLKWIPELNQYEIKIDNLVLRGNLANIYDKNMINNDNICAHQVIPCKNKNNCYNILSHQYCKYYHNPMDLIKLKNSLVITQEFYNQTIKYTRNFASTSWLYSPIKNKKNTYMRSIGSKTTLDDDINIMKLKDAKEEIENMKQQVMHDLLVLLKIEKSLNI
jgi:hypothetical protein